MRTLTRVLVITVAALLLFGCTARQRPGADASPDAGSGDPIVSQASSVLPDLTPKADLAMTPAGEVNVSYAPDVPAAATRTNQAVVNVAFDIVEGVQAIDPNGTQRVLFIEVPDDKVVKNRMHLDLEPTEGTRDEELARLLAHGATQVADLRGTYGPGTGWVVLADPEGNEFCILRSSAEREAAAAQ